MISDHTQCSLQVPALALPACTTALAGAMAHRTRDVSNCVCCHGRRLFYKQAKLFLGGTAPTSATAQPASSTLQSNVVASAVAAATAMGSPLQRRWRRPPPHQPDLWSVESAFLASMRLRERWMAGSKSMPDFIAKNETFQSLSAGKEHPAVAAYNNGRCALRRCVNCVSLLQADGLADL